MKIGIAVATLVAVVVVGVGLVLAGGDDDGSEPAADGGGEAVRTMEVTIEDFDFRPPAIEVDAGADGHVRGGGNVRLLLHLPPDDEGRGRRQVTSALRYVAAVLVLIVGLVHLQQYVDFISEIPTVGVMFLLNAAGGAALAVALLWPDRALRQLAAFGGIALCVGSLVAIALSMGPGIFGYLEPNWRGAVVLSVAVELAALPALVGYLVQDRRTAPA